MPGPRVESPGPQPRGKLRGIWSRPTAKGVVEGIWSGGVPGPGRLPAPGGACSRVGVPGGDPLTVTSAGSTHPTGMLSCSHSLYVPKGHKFELEIKPIELQPFMNW